MTFVVVIE